MIHTVNIHIKSCDWVIISPSSYSRGPVIKPDPEIFHAN